MHITLLVISCIWLITPRTRVRTTVRTTAKPTSTVKTVTTHTTQDTSTTTTTKATSLDTPTLPKPIQSTSSLSDIDGQSTASNQQAYKDGSTTSAVAAGVSVTVAIAVSAVVFVLVLRNRRKLCFEHKNSLKLKNRDDNHHISLARVKSKPTSYSQTPGTSVSNQTYSALQNASTCTKDADKYYPVANTDVRHQNTNITQRNHDSEAHDGFEQQRSASDAISTEVQQPNIGNNNDVLTNEVHPYFVLEKEGDHPVHDRPLKEANPYFELKKQTNGNSPPITTPNALESDIYDGDTYQEIDLNDTYADIDDSREDNNDYDYTNKGLKDSKTETSDNVYNHLNAAGDEYDHVGKSRSNVNAMENNYDITSGDVRK